MKIVDAIGQLVSLQHRIAVYEDIKEHLEQYLPDDFGDKEQILLEIDGCLRPVVEESTIEDVLEEVDKLMKEAVKEKTELENKRISTPRKRKEKK